MTSIVLACAAALGGGFIATYLAIPLAWMLGPLLTVAALRLCGYRLKAPPASRESGQVIVGVAAGLQLTPSVFDFLLGQIELIMIAGVTTIVCGLPFTFLLRRLSGEDATTCYFATVPGGLAEMATLGEQYGARQEPIAIAQTLRLALIVVTVPPLLAYSGLTGNHESLAETVQLLSAMVTLVILALAGLVSLLLTRLHITNAWLLGGILVGIVVAVIQARALAIPELALHGAQYLLGMGLGVLFRRDYITRVPTFIQAAAISVFVMMFTAALAAYAVSMATSHGFGTLLLAFAPGGITEMVLTAKALNFSAPLITAVHLTRIVLVVLLTSLVFRWTILRR